MSKRNPYSYAMEARCECCGKAVPKVNRNRSYVCRDCKEKIASERKKEKVRVCKVCGEHKKASEWQRDAGGRLSKHCGCRNRSRIKATTESKLEKRAMWKRIARIRGLSGFKAIKHDAHVRAFIDHDKALKKKPILHDAHVIEWRKDGTRQYKWRYRHDQVFRIKERLRRQLKKKAKIESIEAAVRASIRGRSSGAAIERLLGYSMSDLKKHLNRQFRGGMSWDTYGIRGWHIDHIMPKRCFDLTTADGVRAYWALPNLRPLPAKENLKKNANVIYLL